MSGVRVAALLACALAPPLYLVGTAGRALHNGDEAIYAEMAREMADGGGWATPRWQGEVLLPRPPAVAWILAGARKLLGSDERAVRWPLALAAGAQLALLMMLGATLYTPSVGVMAGLMLGSSDLFIGYARYLESEPFLCVFVLGALLCYETARARPRWIVGYGLLLGAALLTKQVIGGLPLLAPLVDRMSAEPRRVARGTVIGGLLVALAVAAPWHVYAVIRHRDAFVEQFLGALVRRSAQAMHHQTRPTFYVRELWRSEGPFGLLGIAGVGVTAIAAGVRRQRADVLVATWALGSFGLFTLSRSRYDYYLLVAYPALALASAALVTARLPARPLVRQFAACAIVAAAALAHLPRNLAAFDGDDQVRALARLASARYAPPARLYVYNRHPYSARYYSRLDVSTLFESAEDFRLAETYQRAGLPNAPVQALDLSATLRVLPRPFALLHPRKRGELAGDALTVLAESPHYRLYGAD